MSAVPIRYVSKPLEKNRQAQAAGRTVKMHRPASRIGHPWWTAIVFLMCGSTQIKHLYHRSASTSWRCPNVSSENRVPAPRTMWPRVPVGYSGVLYYFQLAHTPTLWHAACGDTQAAVASLHASLLTIDISSKVKCHRARSSRKAQKNYHQRRNTMPAGRLAFIRTWHCKKDIHIGWETATVQR
jgi:hypothetical protein